MLACSQGSPGHQRVVDLILAHHRIIDINYISAWKWTALIWASVGGVLEVVERLLDLGADPNAMTSQNDTALSKAIEYGHHPIVDRLLAHGVLFSSMDCLRKSLEVGKIALAKEFYQRALSHGDIPRLHVFYSDSAELNRVIYKLVSSSLSELHQLSIEASRSDFFFHLFLHCISSAPAPKVFLQVQLPILASGLCSSHRTTDVDLVGKVVSLIVAVKQAKLWHPQEARALGEIMRSLELVLHGLLQHPLLNDEQIIHLCLLAEDDQDDDHYPHHRRETYRDEVVRQSQALYSKTIRAVLSAEIKSFFAHAHIASYLLDLFWTGTKHCPDNRSNSRGPLSALLTALTAAPLSREASPFALLGSSYLHGRYRPMGKKFM